MDYYFLLPLFVLMLKFVQIVQKPIQAVPGVLLTCPHHFFEHFVIIERLQYSLCSADVFLYVLWEYL